MKRRDFLAGPLVRRSMVDDPRMERVGDSVFSRSADDRMPCTCSDCKGERFLVTRAEHEAWARENMPNGYCICSPEKGIVCGQHDPRG